MDADDWWEPSFLQEMIHLIEQYPDAGMYGCKYKQIMNNKTIDVPIQLSHDFREGYIDYIQSALENGFSPVWSSAVVVDKEKFQQVGGFNPKLTSGEDQEFWLRMALNFKTAYVNKSLAYYNMDIDVSTELPSKRQPTKEQFFIFNLDYFIPFEKENKQLKKLLDMKRLQNLSTYYLKDMYPQEVKNILGSIEYFPLKFKLFYKSPRVLVNFFFCAHNDVLSFKLFNFALSKS
ncbi:hypothetical protein FACS1894195_2970 [Bacteroidia bacterium]|nr:hypothetical protein FACS1894195_2970 [Bacteroidia bacterium]